MDYQVPQNLKSKSSMGSFFNLMKLHQNCTRRDHLLLTPNTPWSSQNTLYKFSKPSLSYSLEYSLTIEKVQQSPYTKLQGYEADTNPCYEFALKSLYKVLAKFFDFISL